MVSTTGFITDPQFYLDDLPPLNLDGKATYHRSRSYNPTIGRFNRLDPYAGDTENPLSLHKYNYAHANPVMEIDPSGTISLEPVSKLPEHNH